MKSPEYTCTRLPAVNGYAAWEISWKASFSSAQLPRRLNRFSGRSSISAWARDSRWESVSVESFMTGNVSPPSNFLGENPLLVNATHYTRSSKFLKRQTRRFFCDGISARTTSCCRVEKFQRSLIIVRTTLTRFNQPPSSCERSSGRACICKCRCS